MPACVPAEGWELIKPTITMRVTLNWTATSHCYLNTLAKLDITATETDRVTLQCITVLGIFHGDSMWELAAQSTPYKVIPDLSMLPPIV